MRDATRSASGPVFTFFKVVYKSKLPLNKKKNNALLFLTAYQSYEENTFDARALA